MSEVKQYTVSKGQLIDIETMQDACIYRLVSSDDYWTLESERDSLRAEVERLRIALSHADAWIEAAPHGENCFVSNRYDGDPGNRCNCGKDAAQETIGAALESSR
ncbi:hypothetical protein SAMN04244572_03213 [Azotobacter beijerinckii]|uniref:Ead/Ea22-like family protein n=1 Tax=Azotobacter beijerinckii TaxID=170623 RepID=A0A1H6X2S1_9GAMM|nr:hypothetical protein [Azotobacter beijerinckii]SEJ23473.1 hypothetical protein SAMN04244572_03213 [Azotobacter beijerinckii]